MPSKKTKAMHFEMVLKRSGEKNDPVCDVWCEKGLEDASINKITQLYDPLGRNFDCKGLVNLILYCSTPAVLYPDAIKA